MSGGKGGSQTSQVTVPQYIEDAARANLSRAGDVANIGPIRYEGPDVAAYSPMQMAAARGRLDAVMLDFALVESETDVREIIEDRITWEFAPEEPAKQA